MNRYAIKVEGLSKEYVVGKARHQHDTFYDLLSHSLKAPLQRLSNREVRAGEPERFWALRDLNFEIQAGEVVGVIGRNGAGKSTLLKILSRITAPTAGRVEVRGRLSSLLEVGTGFHPELSGRENIFLNGAILGMPRSEVARKFDEIVAFAEVEKFIDTPVKRYSSGMYVRLAFAVAAHLEPDILVVDEVLAVGDAAFQTKCMGKMNSIGRAGTTILIVSHNMALMHKLCSKALLLENGQLACAGDLEQVQAHYLSGRADASSTWVPDATDDCPFQYERVDVITDAGDPIDALPANQSFKIRFRFNLLRPVTGRIAFTLRNQYGITIFTSSNTDAFSFMNKKWAAGQHEEQCTFPSGWLVPGSYWLSISRPLPEGNEVIEDVCQLVIDSFGSLVARDDRAGIVAPLLEWSTGEPE